MLPDGFEFVRPAAVIAFGSSFQEPDVFIPLKLDPSRARFADFSFESIGLMAPGSTAADLEKELTSLMHEMPELYPGGLTARMIEQAGVRPVVEIMRDTLLGGIHETLWTVMAAAGFVLLIALLNVFNLFAMRSEGRRREIATRRALGASRRQLGRLFLAESLVVAAAGATLGGFVAWVGIRTIVGLAPPVLPRLSEIAIDGTVAAFVAAIAVGIVLMLLAIPLLRHGRVGDRSWQSDGTRSTTGSKRHNRVRQGLVTAQISFALVLLVSSALLVRTFWNLRHVDPGFTGNGVVALRLSLPINDFPDGVKRTEFLLALTERVGHISGVNQVSFASGLPLGGRVNGVELAVSDAPPEAGVLPPRAVRNFVGPGYFRLLGATLQEGRELELRDYEIQPAVVIINRALAEQRWPGENPIGKRVAQWPEPRLDDPWYTVIGVVGDIHETALTKTPEPTVYLPTRFLAGSSHTMFARSFWLLIETARDPLSIVSAVRGVVEEQHQAVPITSVKTVEQIKLSSIQQTSFMTVTLAASGGAALILAVVGIYSVVAYAVSGRVREFGVRIVVGARPSDIRAMVLRQGGVMGLVGVLVGLAGALGASQLLESMLFGVRGTDPGILALMSFSLLVLVMLSAWLPARRAASVDPADALKAD